MDGILGHEIGWVSMEWGVCVMGGGLEGWVDA